MQWKQGCLLLKRHMSQQAQHHLLLAQLLDTEGLAEILMKWRPVTAGSSLPLQVRNQHSRSEYHQQWMETATEVQKEHQRELLGMQTDKRQWRGPGWREAARYRFCNG